MLEKVKLALRISHTALDEDILGTITVAQNELIRAGVDSSKAMDETDSLIVQAIKTFCQGIYDANDKVREAYMESFKYQMDNLRKSSDYKVGDSDE